MQVENAIRELADTPKKDYLVKAILSQCSLFAQVARYAPAHASAKHAVEAAQQAHLPILEGRAWDLDGIVLLLGGDLATAQESLRKAAAIQAAHSDLDHLAVTREHLAELYLRKHDYPAALQYIDQAFAANTPSFKINAQYYPIHVRAQILVGLGRTSEALAEFKRAVDSATEWRSGALPGDVTGTFTVAQLHDVYQDYAELAATLALKNHDPALARAAFEALAENRAASLREQLALSLDRNFRLPPEYFELVSALQKEQANVTLGEKPQEHEAKLHEIRVQLDDLENRVGLTVSDNLHPVEKKPHKNSLRSIQSRLGASEVLLSFCLGAQKSFVWVVTGDDVSLYQLPDQNAIGAQAQAFAAAARDGRDWTHPGHALSQSLFGQLSPAVWKKRDWLITADGPLLNGIPFSALPEPSAADAPLAASHSLRLLPSALLLLQRESAPTAPVFVGIADPIYNFADPRHVSLPLVPAKRTLGNVNLARLAGGDREVKTAAAQSGLPTVQLLVGPRASGDGLRQSITSHPAVLHFAVHVVSPPARPQEAALALSLTTDGMPELLTSEAIASYRVPGSLVVMSGCDSEQGKTLPSAGLLGLSRAWLLAGAAAVVVSAWPTPDDSGQFFSSFYAHLQADPGPMPKRAAAALQQAQLDMQRGGGYRSAPSYWAAYSVISKE
jgi:CHAT domain-containing protein